MDRHHQHRVLTRAWVGVEFSSGNAALGSGLGTGPGIGYWRAALPRLGRCLLSSDGGASFDALDPALELAILVQKAPLSSGWLAKGASVVAHAPALETALLGARPNPFNPRTEIGFTLAATGPVMLAVYDLRGRLVRKLVDAPQVAGEHWLVWDGLDNDGSPVASGGYHAELRAGGIRAQQKLLLVR